jgi:hypothetical protein
MPCQSHPRTLQVNILLYYQAYNPMQLTVAQSTKPQHSMESEGSLMCSQEPVTGPYPAPVKSNLRSPLKINFNAILQPIPGYPK